MPTKMVLYREKAVILTMYVERPKRKRVSLNHDKPHYHQQHNPITQMLLQHKNTSSGQGYNRRAQLLHYCQCLRKNEKSANYTPRHVTLVSSNHDQTKPKISAVQEEQKNSTSFNCLSNWKFFIPSYLHKEKQKKKKEKRHSKMPKRWNFISKLLSALPKWR